VNPGRQQHKTRTRYFHLANGVKAPCVSKWCERIVAGAFLIQSRNDASPVRGCGSFIKG
jgi:hypothetical protein